jgi:1-acyl-sn-glycerol-3-phosphate acyltransferase
VDSEPQIPRSLDWVLRSAGLARRSGIWSLSVSGAENIPKDGPYLAAANHCGVLPFDALIGVYAYLDSGIPVDRIPRPIVAPPVARLPIIRELNKVLDGLTTSELDLLDPKIFKNGRPIALYPEGERGNTKPFWRAYNVSPLHRGVQIMALEHDIPTLPITIVGGAEASPSLWQINLPKNPLHVRYAGIPLTPVPLPTHWEVHFGELVAPDADQARFLDTLEQSMSDDLARMASGRRLFKLQRLVGEVRRVLEPGSGAP